MGISSGKENFAGFLILGIVLAVVAMIPAFKYTMFSELAVTNKKIYGKTGFIKTNEMGSPLSKSRMLLSPAACLAKSLAMALWR